MERDPGDIGSDSTDEVDAMSDDALSAWLEALPPWPGPPNSEEELAKELAEANADIAAGRVYPHEVVGAWLKTWGSPAYLPFDEWLKSSG